MPTLVRNSHLNTLFKFTSANKSPNMLLCVHDRVCRGPATLAGRVVSPVLSALCSVSIVSAASVSVRVFVYV